MPIVPREGAFSSRKHKRSIISSSDPSWGCFLHARLLKGRRSPRRAGARPHKNMYPTDNALLWNRVCSIILCWTAAVINQMKVVLRGIKRRLWAFFLCGSRLHCPLCAGSYRRFRAAGDPPRENAMCPGCASLERHRLLWIALEKQWQKGMLRAKDRMLHVAPEPVLAKKFEQRFGEYVSIDADGRRAMKAMDVTALAFADRCFDAVVCNHVPLRQSH